MQITFYYGWFFCFGLLAILFSLCLDSSIICDLWVLQLLFTDIWFWQLHSYKQLKLVRMQQCFYMKYIPKILIHLFCNYCYSNMFIEDFLRKNDDKINATLFWIFFPLLFFSPLGDFVTFFPFNYWSSLPPWHQIWKELLMLYIHISVWTFYYIRRYAMVVVLPSFPSFARTLAFSMIICPWLHCPNFCC